MRPIKFRAWDKQLNIMVYAGNEVIFYLNYLPQRIIMQFTGLTDKNGIEIYESDIVIHEYESEYGPLEHRDVVEYLGGAFYPICEKPENEFEVIGNIYETPELLKS